tara:strand:+ start:317 stop:1591 length:1275 start_codon:yes stop_codon:yes gene_type:complete
MDEFKTGYYLSKLNTIYPYFLNVHSVLECEYKSIRTQNEIKNGHIMLVDKGTETIVQYLNNKCKEYLIFLIPDLEEKIKLLDNGIEDVLKKYLNKNEIDINLYNLEDNIDKQEYEIITNEIHILIKNFYLSFKEELITFQTEFIPLFLKNYKVIIDSYFLVDIVTLNNYNDYIPDKKSDNFMIRTIPYDEDIIYRFRFNEQFYKINNVLEWFNKKEYCFLYPVDFGSLTINLNLKKLSNELLNFYYNKWILNYFGLYLFSDNNNFSWDKNILKLETNKISLNFSKYYSYFESIFDKYNIFTINLINPLMLYELGLETCNTNNYQEELNKLYEEEEIMQRDDYINQNIGDKKIFEIRNLEEAIIILKIHLDGSTVIYDNYHNNYRNYSSGLGFHENNSLGYNFKKYKPNTKYIDFDFSKKYNDPN